MKMYLPKNWYWFVAGDQTKVFSSAAGDYVPISDPAYIAWASDGTTPQNIDTEANLGAVLAPYLIRPINANVLDGYTGSQADTVLQHLFFKVAFNHENRLRAIERQLSLNGSPANLSAAQARAAVKALM